MARIAGVDLPRNKRIEIALTYIYGIGRHAANVVPRRRRASRPTRRATISTRATFARSATRSSRTTASKATCAATSQLNIKRLIDLGCYRGLRHRRNLPVRGQRTHTNARTRKGPRRMAVKKHGRGHEEVRRGNKSMSHRQSQAEEEGPEEHPDRRRAHLGDVQQHDRLDHRRLRQRRRVVVGRHVRLQGLAQVDAVRRAARRRGRRQEGDGARRAQRAPSTSTVPAPVASRRSARSTRPASRSTSSATSRPFRTTVAGRPSAAASDHL